VCEGYRDESTIMFRYETDKVIEHARASASSVRSSSSTTGSHLRSRSADSSRDSRRSSSTIMDPSDLTLDEANSLNLRSTLPWVKQAPEQLKQSVEDQAVDQFMEKYVIYPCNQTSSPGFLEHLPYLFKDLNVKGRYALRWAVRAAAYADLSKDSEGDHMSRKAMHCYGLSLAALGESLLQPGKVPDDYDLLTVVILDIFEASLINTEKKRNMSLFFSDRLRRCLYRTPRRRELTRRVWHRYSGFVGRIRSTALEVGVYLDLPITES
jgi:hypothetical protein